jgi:imidazolonepropionase
LSLLLRDARIVVGDGSRPPFRGALRIEGQHILELGPELTARPGESVLEADGRVLLPGFVDAHTHALFAGDRLDEFELRQQGKSYLEILAAGGGILSTVRAVRQSSERELADGLRERLFWMLEQGTTSMEVKSGYGLSTREELKMLRAIQRATEGFPGTVVATALLGHAIDPAVPQFVEQVVTETLPAVHAEFPGLPVDAFCEQNAFSVNDCRRLLQRARELGHPLRLHADQFTALGGLELGLELGARSVDHLEASSHETLLALAQSDTYGVLLPVSGFHTDGRYADARSFHDAGGKLVLASNCNPGSSPCASLPFVIALSLRKLGLTVHEAIRACTHSAAALLGLNDRGVLAPGMRADLILLRHRDERLLGYELGGNPVQTVLVGGRTVFQSASGLSSEAQDAHCATFSGLPRKR